MRAVGKSMALVAYQQVAAHLMLFGMYHTNN